MTANSFLRCAAVVLAFGFLMTPKPGLASEAMDLPKPPPNDRPYVDPGAYDDACMARWPSDVRCRTACLEAAACATDDHGPCQNPVLLQCEQKRKLADDQGRPVEAPKR